MTDDGCPDGPEIETVNKILNKAENTPTVAPKLLQNAKEPNIVTAYDDDFLDMNCDDMDLF